MHKAGVPGYSPLKLLCIPAILIVVLALVVGCTSETPETTATMQPTEAAQPTPTQEPSPTLAPTETPSPTATPRPTATPTPVPTPTPIPNRSPVITNPGSKSYKQGEVITPFSITVTDAEDTPTVTLTGLPSNLSYNSGQVSGTIDSDTSAEDYAVTISTDDGVNPVVSATFTITVAPNNPPVIANLDNKSYHQGATIEAFDITVTDDEDTPSVALSGLPSGLSYMSGRVIGAIDSDTTAGDYAITISADDRVNPVVSATFIITVMPNTPPIITNPGNKRYDQGETIAAFDITVTDAEDTPTVTLTGLPPGLSYISGEISGTIDSDATAKDYVVAAFAADNSNPSVSATFTITVISSREAMLRERVLILGNAHAIWDWPTEYSLASDDFSAKCSLSEYTAYRTFVNDRIGPTIPQGSTYVLEDVVIEENYAWVHSHFVKDGRQIFHDENQRSANERPEYIWKGNHWEPNFSPEYLALEQPCSLDRYMGFFIDLPLSVGSTMHGADGIEVRVTQIWQNAWPVIYQENQYNDPPDQGKRFFMVRVEVTNPLDSSRSVDASQYKFNLIGDNRVVYTQFNASCAAVLPEALDSEVFPGGRVEGNICFEIPQEERGLILIHQPWQGAEYRRFLRITD